MGVRYIKLPDTEIENLPRHFFHVVGLDFQPDRSCSPQELALIRDIPIEKPDIEVFSQTKEVPFVLLFRDFATEDVTIKFPDAVPILSRNYTRRMVSTNHIAIVTHFKNTRS